MYNFIKNKVEERQITLDDIKNVEEKFKIQFPKKLVEFLLEYNGAEIFLCEIVKNDVAYEVAALIPVKYGKLPVEKIMEWNKMDGIIREALIPLARDRGGNIYYIDSISGEILLHFSDDYYNPKQISTDFQSFLKKISICE